MKTKRYLFVSTILSVFLLTGCAEDKELTAFHASFENFCNNVAEIDSSINSIDANAETAPTELLTLLDQLEVEFQELASLDVPEEFEYLTDLADEASENMTLAVENYHTAFESDPHDTSAANIASQYYERAYKRVKYMVTFLHGDVPDDENVSVEIVEE